MTINTKVAFCLLFTSLVWMEPEAFAQTSLDPNSSAAETRQEKDARMQWWRDARFGMFIHWGPVSLKGTEIGWSRKGLRRDRDGTGDIPAEEYDVLYKQFNPTLFDAKEWVDIAKAAGMKYMVMVAKHHDGFCMFDSKLTDYTITHSPFQRDVCAELARACHNADIRLGFYYSPPDWHHPDFFTENHARYIDYLHGQVRELLTNYGQVDILWFDADGGKNTAQTWGNAGMFPMIRKLQPQILLTKRCGGWGDFDTPEQHVGGFQTEDPWETCMTICRQWAWKPDDKMKSLEECMGTLIRCAGGDGNLLFNVGPMPDGRIEPRQVERLREMGQWLAKYGESIYGTRGGPFKPGNWGVSTHKDRTIYVHVLKWPETNVILPPISQKIIKSRCLTGGDVTVSQTDRGVELSLPQSHRNAIDTIVVLELDQSVRTGAEDK